MLVPFFKLIGHFAAVYLKVIEQLHFAGGMLVMQHGGCFILQGMLEADEVFDGMKQMRTCPRLVGCRWQVFEFASYGSRLHFLFGKRWIQLKQVITQVS